MGKTVDLDRMADLLPGYGFAFLVTVGDDHRAHTTAITPSYADGVFDVGVVGRHGRANLAQHPGVTLVFPARDVGEYSLFVDGDAELPDDPAAPEAPVRVRPTKALLHRPTAVSGVYDCVQLSRG